MKYDSLLAHIKNSVDRALKHDSHIDAEILQVKGFSTGVMRRLISNLCHHPDSEERKFFTYLEVGVYCGGTFCAAINNNPTIQALAIDDFSQPFGVHDFESQFFGNLKKFMPLNRFSEIGYLQGDCFKVGIDELFPNPIDIFFFDGEHSFESQSKALPYYFEAMAKDFIFIVDDFNWPDVSRGTLHGLAEMDDKIERSTFIHLIGETPNDDPIWHNGMGIFLISKK